MSAHTPSGPDDYSQVSARFRLEQGSPQDFDLARSRQFLYVEHFHQAPVEEEGRREWDQSKDVYGVKLHNDRLEVYFSLVAHPRLHTETDYTGAATNVSLKEAEIGGAGEMLCPFGEWAPKRWGQLTELVFFPLPWELKWFSRIPLVGERDRRYRLIATNSGLMRATVTLKSERLKVEYDGRPFAKSDKIEIDCHLYRVLSFYPEKPFYVEDLFVLSEEGHSISFRPYYLSEVHFQPAVPKHLARFEHTPDFLAFWSQFAGVHRGYGFAADSHIRGIDMNGDQLRWRLPLTHYNRCIHQFMFHGWGEGFDAYHEIGHYGWYERIFKPLDVVPLNIFSVASRYATI